MTPIHVVGIGLDGADGLVESVRQLVENTALLVGSDRHLSYFPNYRGILSDVDLLTTAVCLPALDPTIPTSHPFLTSSSP